MRGDERPERVSGDRVRGRTPYGVPCLTRGSFSGGMMYWEIIRGGSLYATMAQDRADDAASADSRAPAADGQDPSLGDAASARARGLPLQRRLRRTATRALTDPAPRLSAPRFSQMPMQSKCTLDRRPDPALDRLGAKEHLHRTLVDTILFREVWSCQKFWIINYMVPSPLPKRCNKLCCAYMNWHENGDMVYPYTALGRRHYCTKKGTYSADCECDEDDERAAATCHAGACGTTPSSLSKRDARMHTAHEPLDLPSRRLRESCVLTLAEYFDLAEIALVNGSKPRCTVNTPALSDESLGPTWRATTDGACSFSQRYAIAPTLYEGSTGERQVPGRAHGICAPFGLGRMPAARARMHPTRTAGDSTPRGRTGAVCAGAPGASETTQRPRSPPLGAGVRMWVVRGRRTAAEGVRTPEKGPLPPWRQSLPKPGMFRPRAGVLPRHQPARSSSAPPMCQAGLEQLWWEKCLAGSVVADEVQIARLGCGGRAGMHRENSGLEKVQDGGILAGRSRRADVADRERGTESGIWAANLGRPVFRLPSTTMPSDLGRCGADALVSVHTSGLCALRALLCSSLYAACSACVSVAWHIQPVHGKTTNEYAQLQAKPRARWQ
ncbi:hypothetical protein WOLCODRAFT_141440 [Wolfiporia cocos MD-104 SS10]|uniref:Uncharacterized protein n=1 Tax=Wolfiporia cocos (strain MD-104) TaxID=742152 RepID=A0A2H3ISL9_WOLCO|nr:hypothetical protein WOLCODRAFT_141440 [Wolfiporia cocos MD-104 SS10]